MTPRTEETGFEMRGVVVTWNDLVSADWLTLASEASLNLVSVHTSEPLTTSAEGRQLLHQAERLGIAIEQEKHAMADLLPRDLFDAHPDYFRMDKNGQRTPDFNCCPSSPEALEIIATNAAVDAREQGSVTGRFYFWLDDGGEQCECSRCADLSPSDQALLVENTIAEALTAENNSFTLSHLAYQSTMAPPTQITPRTNIFLEFAPFFRSWDHPLANAAVFGAGWERTVPTRESKRAERRDDITVSHQDYASHLIANLDVFGRSTAQALEYWLDVSLFSDWKQPSVQLPWNGETFVADLDFYGRQGIRRITSFAVYMDEDYFRRFPDKTPILEYGHYLSDWRGQ
ncbi:MAG TPA: DUF4838 domain-containing protein [Marmoricola sp.]|nr:DUF4838 domain-containing protein [Marmoricola sp.]